VGRDLLDDAEFEAVIGSAANRAAEIVAHMRGGRIDRDPTDDKCPAYCTFQTICRRERGVARAPAEAREEEEPEE
jgi:hypothetical protein